MEIIEIIEVKGTSFKLKFLNGEIKKIDLAQDFENAKRVYTNVHMWKDEVKIGEFGELIFPKVLGKGIGFEGEIDVLSFCHDTLYSESVLCGK